MISLNDYLYSGDTVLKILHRYSDDLRKDAIEKHNQIDLMHSNFLVQITELLEHNDFLSMQSQKIRDFYKCLAEKFPFLAFTFRGRLKSLIRSEEKFNGYLVMFTCDFYKKHGTFPTVADLKNRLVLFRDLIAYRIVISLPKCHIRPGQDRREEEIKYLYEIANILPEFLEEEGFTVEAYTRNGNWSMSPHLNESVASYYRDYIENPRTSGYRSLHITLYDNTARCYFELQLRTKEMDDYAEIGPANHLGYEQRQEEERSRRALIPKGECVWFDDAYERGQMLRHLDLSKLDVNMFTAVSNTLINDGCGLFRGRLILPYEHLSRFQNDLID